MEVELEVKHGNWIARVRGNVDEVRSAAGKLQAILAEAAGDVPIEPIASTPVTKDLLSIAARQLTEMSLSEAVLVTLALNPNESYTKEALAGKLRQLGKSFSEITLEKKTVPSMSREGLLHFRELRTEGGKGQALRAYSLTERGKLDAERIIHGFSSNKQ